MTNPHVLIIEQDNPDPRALKTIRETIEIPDADGFPGAAIDLTFNVSMNDFRHNSRVLSTIAVLDQIRFMLGESIRV